jgi:hypothetical protein
VTEVMICSGGVESSLTVNWMSVRSTASGCGSCGGMPVMTSMPLVTIPGDAKVMTGPEAAGTAGVSGCATSSLLSKIPPKMIVMISPTSLIDSRATTAIRPKSMESLYGGAAPFPAFAPTARRMPT